MKKTIIIPVLMCISTGLFAQEQQRFNTDGTTGVPKSQANQHVTGNSTMVDLTAVNPDGTPKRGNSEIGITPNEVNIKVDLHHVNADGTPVGSTKPQYKPAEKIAEPLSDDQHYRANSNVDNPELAGKNEHPHVRNTENRNLIGTNDDAPARQLTPGADKGNTVPSTAIPDHQKHLSDAELNTMYPQRNQKTGVLHDNSRNKSGQDPTPKVTAPVNRKTSAPVQKEDKQSK